MSDKKDKRIADGANGALDLYLAHGAAKFAKAKMTGREALFHGTSDSRADAIRKLGLKPNAETSIGKMVEGVEPAAYMTKNKTVAKGYAQQASDIEKLIGRHGKNGPKFEEAFADYVMSPERQLGTMMPRDGDVVKASVPTWKLKTIRNPELGEHTLTSWPAEMVRRTEKMTGEKMGPLQRLLTKGASPMSYLTFSQDHVFPEGVPTKYIKGGADYERLGMSELGQYLRKHPGKAGLGVGAAALAAGLASRGIGKVKSAITGEE